MTIPLRHFVVGLAFLLAGVVAGLAQALGWRLGLVGVAMRHLLLVGWVAITIMGAMTQFVPVWSGVAIHDRRLASLQLGFVTAGLVGLVAGLVTARWVLLPIGGGLLVAGFWAFIYNTGRTLAQLEEWDITEVHFALSLGFLAVLTVLGLLLATDLHTPLLDGDMPDRVQVIGAHATLAVFGFVLTTVAGALYQLSTMFTQTELRSADLLLQRIELGAYPSGVVLLASGRLLGYPLVARVGGLLLIVGLAALAGILGRRLLETLVPWTPMLQRYAVVVIATLLWAGLTIPAWLADPLGPGVRLGGPGTEFLLLVGVIGFVVLGTAYHVVPFIVWVHRYSDRLGFEEVPMIEDLFDPRLAVADLACFAGGTVMLVGADLLGTPTILPGWTLLVVGVLAVLLNLLSVIHRHSPYSIPGLLGGTLGRRVRES